MPFQVRPAKQQGTGEPVVVMADPEQGLTYVFSPDQALEMARDFAHAVNLILKHHKKEQDGPRIHTPGA